MMLSLFTMILLFGAAFIALGLPFILGGSTWERACKAFLRSTPAAVVTMGIGGLWFLWKIANLAQADFGDYKKWLLMLFGGTLIGSFFVVRDFLSVRGAAVIALMASNEALKSAFGLYDQPARLVLVVAAYFLIITALYLGTIPFRLRDFFNWLFIQPRRPKILGSILTATGTALLLSAFLI